MSAAVFARARSPDSSYGVLIWEVPVEEVPVSKVNHADYMCDRTEWGVKVCQMDPATQLCLGCCRTQEERDWWVAYTSAQQREVLPLFRRGAAKEAIEGGLHEQLERLANEPGVRKQL